MNFNELFESAYSQDLHLQPRKFVEFYDHNRILIEGQNISTSTSIYDRVTRLTSDYAHSLTLNESHSKAKTEIDKALKLFQNHPDYQGLDLLELKYYEALLFDRAVVNYYSKNYPEAIRDLTQLAERFPDDEKFRNWLRAAKSYKLTEFENTIYVIAALALIADIFIEDLHPLLNIAITTIFAVSLLAIGAIELIKFRRKKST